MSSIVSSESKKANNEFFKTTDLQTKQGVDLEKQSINQQYNVQDQGLSADHTYSIDKDNVCPSNDNILLLNI